MTIELKGMNTSREHAGKSLSGYPMLLLMLALVALPAWWAFAALPGSSDGQQAAIVITMIAAFASLLFIACGFFMIQPNQGTVLTLFGEYRGTERREGLRWVWPWIMRKNISLRAHNVHSERVKINDLRGNPIDIACNVVWRVQDSAQAVFDVDDYKQFVNIQIEAGLRTVGSRHPYDDFENEEVTLRGSGGVVNHELLVELNDRVKVAGIVVDEAGLTHLAYASEIAQAMLRRQQAEAVIAARAKLVMGAVGMVEDALTKLSQDGIVDLDNERRATMVSNLMVVLCGEREAQPVVNAGTLYQ